MNQKPVDDEVDEIFQQVLENVARRWGDKNRPIFPDDSRKAKAALATLINKEKARARIDELKLLDDKIWLTAADVQNILDDRLKELEAQLTKDKESK